ncbi:A24 family peptidase [Egicoccus sp. AB-alg6-2]|uniref:prepilin peptidase n=1 Tax=Egicoccus sp. AB-alg6-2 TaxID=3242692 RepID=UPI00359D3124
MDAAVVALAVIIGLLVGSFANVPIHRWPRGGTVTSPKRSACPACGALISARDNVPVVSWLLLQRRCRHCGAPIAARYAVVEATTAILFGAVAWVWGLDPILPVLLVFTWSLVVATAIDLEHRIIPNRLTYRLPFVLLALLVPAAAFTGTWTDLRRALIWAVAVPGIMFLFAEAFRLVRGQTGMGMGDVKLAISIGLVVGYLGGVHLVAFAYGTMISAVIVVVVLLAMRRAKLASRIPFGPYLAAGALIPVLAPDGSAAVVRSVLGLG